VNLLEGGTTSLLHILLFMDIKYENSKNLYVPAAVIKPDI